MAAYVFSPGDRQFRYVGRVDSRVGQEEWNDICVVMTFCEVAGDRILTERRLVSLWTYKDGTYRLTGTSQPGFDISKIEADSLEGNLEELCVP